MVTSLDRSGQTPLIYRHYQNILYHISLFFSILSEFKNIKNSSQSGDNDRLLVSISARVLYPLGRIMVIIAVTLISCPILNLAERQISNLMNSGLLTIGRHYTLTGNSAFLHFKVSKPQYIGTAYTEMHHESKKALDLQGLSVNFYRRKENSTLRRINQREALYIIIAKTVYSLRLMIYA